MNHFRTMIVEAAAAEGIRAFAALWQGGQGMFTRALTTDGTTASHYISSGYIGDSIGENVPYVTVSTVVDPETEEVTQVVTQVEGDLEALKASIEASNEGVEVTVEALQAMLAATDVSDQQPHDAMARLGLSFLAVSNEP